MATFHKCFTVGRNNFKVLINIEWMFGSSVNTVQFFFEEGIDILKLNKNGSYFLLE